MAISKLQFDQLKEQGIDVHPQAMWDLALAHVAHGQSLHDALITAAEELMQLQLDGSALRIDLGERKVQLASGSVAEWVLQMALRLDLSQSPPAVNAKLEQVRQV